MISTVKKVHIADACLYAALLLCVCLITLQSGSSPLSRSMPQTDSSVFIYVARTLLNGGTMYVDCFDHKGPFLYVLNVVGQLINPRWGICFLDFVFLSWGIILAYKGARLAFSKPVSFLGAILAFLYLGKR